MKGEYPPSAALSFTNNSEGNTSSSSSAPPRGQDRVERSPSMGGTTMGTKKKVLVHKDIQSEAHYRQLLEQGKLRHGSIIKGRDRRRKGSEGENVILGLDGQVAGRLPRSLSIGSLSGSLSESIDVSHSSCTADVQGDCNLAGAAANMTPTSSYMPSYTLRERDQHDELWIIIVNGLKKKEWEMKCARLLNQLSLVKWKVYLTRYPGHAKKLAMRAQNKGADMIIAVGGDGHLDEVVDGMLRSHCRDDNGVPKAELSVLPLGRANDFHRSMGWDPDSFEDGLWRIGRGHTALIDVGKVTCIGANGAPMASHFLNMASMGSNAKVCGRLENYSIFGKLRHTVASVLETWKHVVLRPRADVLVSYDDGEWEHIKNVTLLAACNGCSFARGKKLSESAHPYNGSLDMVTMGSTGSLLSIGRAFQRMSEGTPSRCRHISGRTCFTVDVLPSDRRGKALVGEISRGDVEPKSTPMSTGSMPRVESAASISSQGGIGDSEGGCGTGYQHVSQKKMACRAQIKRLLSKSTHPIEIGGTVVGELPATFAVVPNAIKLRIPPDENRP